MLGRKSDIKDSQWIARLLYNKMLRPSFVPDKHIRELRAYTRKEVELHGRRTALLQELERILELCNIRITSFASVIDSKSVCGVIELIIKGEYDPKLFLQQIHGRILNRHKEKITDSLQGFVPPYQRDILEMTYEELLMVESHISKLSAMASEVCRKTLPKRVIAACNYSWS